MKKKISLFLLFVSATALFAANTREIHINRTSFKPGEVLGLMLPRHYHVAPTVTWRNETYEFRPTWNNSWHVMIPIPRGTNPGDELIYIDPRAPAVPDLYEGSLNFKIEKVNESTETITMPSEKVSLVGSTDEEKESSVIHEFLKAASSDQTQYWRGTFVPPVPGIILSHFGVNRKRVGQEKLEYHKGVDLSAREGQPVLAANDGIVLLAKEFNFHGRTVLLSHGQGVCTIYLHLKEIDITEGDHVKRGQTIGRVGSSGFSTGPHLHWGLYVNTQPVDPEQWLKDEF